MAAASHADAPHGSEPRTFREAPPLREVPPGAVQKYWTPNIGCNIRISLATGIPEYDEYVKSISWPSAVGSVIAEVTVRLVTLAARLGSIPRLFCHR